MIFESHAHYNDEAFNEDRDVLLSSMEENGIGHIINVSSNLASVKETLELTGRYDFIYGAVGIHPSDTVELNDESFLWLTGQARTRKVVAIGEIGLDYYWPEPDQEYQKKWFIRQLELAKELDLPVIIHSRDAAADTLDILKQPGYQNLRGVIHCYSYTKEMAKEYCKLGYYFGIGGVITFSNARKLVETVEYLPLERILLETDCPYLAPVPYRGKRNSSFNIPIIAQKIGDIKNIAYETVVEQTERNAKALFGLL